MQKSGNEARKLPIDKSEKELELLVSECKELQEILQFNIVSLLESFDEAIKNDNYQSKKRRESKE